MSGGQSRIKIDAVPGAESASWIPKELHPNRVRTSKYSMLTFVPLNLYHQLSKYSTAFFFATLLLLCIPPISPFSPWPYMLAFLIVVGVSMAKDGIEDYKRHTNDRKVNLQLCTMLGREGAVENKFVMDLAEGDMILVHRHDEVPADVVVLRGRNRSGCMSYAFIDTSNLDGESNLKKRISPLSLKFRCDRHSHRRQVNAGTYDPDAVCACFMHARGSVDSYVLRDTGESLSEFCCELGLRRSADCGAEPTTSLDAMEATASARNVLLRGSLLRNIDLAVCLVVAVGAGTKQGRSCLRLRKGKSIFEKKMDYILLIIAGIYAVMLVSTTAVGAYMSYSNTNILYINNYSRIKKVIKLLFSNYILYSYLIPLSLYVMIEVSRFVNSMYIKYDREMKVDGEKSICRNSNVLEDLGIIDYVLTDKTGTITKNAMTLKHFHIAGAHSLLKSGDAFENYSVSENNQLRKIIDQFDHHDGAKSNPNNAEQNVTSKETVNDAFKMLLLNILICNSVEVLNHNYEGISQDELCFLKTLKDHGCELLERDEEYVRIQMGSEEIRLDIIHTVDFTSKRQSMATVARIDGSFYCFVKGSDQRLLSRERDRPVLSLLNGMGDYRLLVMACKRLTSAEVEQIQQAESSTRNQTSSSSLRLIDEHIRTAHYLGATLIEDELQNDVKKTVEMIKNAGMKIWMVTGDKRETALSCARNCGIIDSQTVYRDLEGKDILREMEEIMEARGHPDHMTAGRPSLAFNPAQLGSAQGHADSAAYQSIPNIFDCGSLIIYRTTPKQKGKIASLMIKSGRHTLAIGDGNNDVEMLKDANVGVGIIGKEGMQASLAADFAIPCFKVLQQLIFIHGRYNLMRYAKVAINAYYKNLVFIFIQFFYNFYNAASGKSIYDSFFLNYYNLFFTSLLPFSIALFDRDIPPSKILADSSSYKSCRSYFCKQIIWANVIFAMAESAAIFFIMLAFIRADISSSNGILGGFPVISTLFSIIVFISVILRQIRIISYSTLYSHIALGLSIGFKLIMLFGLAEIGPQNNATIYHALSIPATYILLIGILCMVYSLDSIFDAIEHKLFEVNTRLYRIHKP